MNRRSMLAADQALQAVAKSYDRTIELGRIGVDQYENLPDELKRDPDYPRFMQARASGGAEDSDSSQRNIRDYLAPADGMRFVDLGCCLNLMFKGYDKWPSTYYGVDISSETIALLKSFAAKNNLQVGGLECCSIDETPFADHFFDIGACIGVLEYFKKEYVLQSLKEVHRIIKPGGRLVLDAPDSTGKMRRFMNLVEASMGRPDKLDFSSEEFERLLADSFIIEKRRPFDAVAMIQYFLVRK